MDLQWDNQTITYFQVSTDWNIITSELEDILSEVGIACHSLLQGKGKRKQRFITIPCAFDIETTKIIKENGNQNIRHAYMYIWQLSIADLNIIGRTWDELTQLLNYMATLVSDYGDDTKLIIWDMNLKYESSYMLPRYYKDITNAFFMEKRECIYFDYKDSLRFQDAYLISGCSLDATAKTYNLPHKKAKGDLDYNSLRNSQTPLTQQELYYCIMDTIVLCDFAKFIYARLVPENFGSIPLTKTQIVLNSLYNALGTDKLKAMRNWRPRYNEYLDMSQWLYRGGYVHSNAKYSGQIIEDVDSVDLTSSYPSTIAHGYFPSSRFYKRDIKDKESFYWYLKNRCCWFQVIFTNVKAKTSHTIESKSKIMYYERATWDNGRLYKADKIMVQFNECDFACFNNFYSYSKMQLVWFKMAYKEPIPKEILDTMMSWYLTKAKLKHIDKDSIDYKLAKERINSVYGAFVKKTNIESWTYTNGQWLLEENNPEETYNRAIGKLKMLPYSIGIWITSESRKTLLDMLYKVGDDALYCDTDSIKMKNASNHYKDIDLFNKDILKHNIQLFGDNELTNDLGFFDKDDGHYKRFCSMRAKCYAYEDKEDGTFHSTVSGLKKGVLKSFKEFRDGTKLESEYCDKVTSHYNDEYHEDIVTDYNGVSELMSEYGSCCLYDVGFNISISDDYRDFLNKYYGRRKI